uniref:Uncharacterized protein n=1 Tax=Schistocephalus solidus TaxID=70667 RepID=A0A0V0J9W0_SCHSO
MAHHSWYPISSVANQNPFLKIFEPNPYKQLIVMTNQRSPRSYKSELLQSIPSYQQSWPDRLPTDGIICFYAESCIPLQRLHFKATVMALWRLLNEGIRPPFSFRVTMPTSLLSLTTETW